MNDPINNPELSVSIIIPSHNRAVVLGMCIEKLVLQDYDKKRVELVVVLDGCTDDSFSMISEMKLPFSVNIITLPGLGPAAARNTGAQRATHDLLLFIDDDVLASSNLISSHVSQHTQPGSAIVVGPYIPPRPATHEYLLSNIYQFWNKLFSWMDDHSNSLTFRHVLTGNLSIGRSKFVQLNGFNEKLRAMEDGEFGIRALQHGLKLIYASQASGEHFETTTLRKLAYRRYDEGVAACHIRSLYPTIELQELDHPESKTARLAKTFRPPMFSIVYSMQISLGFAQMTRARNLWHRLYSVYLKYCFWYGVYSFEKTLDS